jgi:autotransporter translocation and assembly factor TamB
MRTVHGWRRVLRWLVGFVIGLVGFVALAVIGLVMAMHTHVGEQLIRDQIQAQLDKTFVGGASIGRLEGTPFTELVVHDVMINGPDRRPAIAIRSLRVDIELARLLVHDVVISKLVADGVEVTLDRDATSHYRVQHLTKPGPPSTWNVWLRSVEVHDARVAVATGRGDEVIHFDDVRVGGAAKLPHGGPTDARVVLNATWRERQAPIALAVVAHVDRDGIWLPAAMAKAGDVAVTAVDVNIPTTAELTSASGTVDVRAPAAAVDQLFDLELPADLAVAMHATPDRGATQVSLIGSLGEAPWQALARIELGDRVKSAEGFVTANDLPLAPLTGGRIDGHGGGLATFALELPREPGELPVARALVQAWTSAGKLPATATLVTLSTTAAHIDAALSAVTVSGSRFAMNVGVARSGGAWTLEHATLRAHATTAERAIAGRSPLRGMLDATLQASGRLAPVADLALAAHVNGQQLSLGHITAGALAIDVDMQHFPARAVGRTHLAIDDLVGATAKQPPVRIALDALVSPGSTIAIDVQRHVVAPAGKPTWEGHSGHIDISRERIAVSSFASESRDGHVALSGTYAWSGEHAGDLAAKVDTALHGSGLGTLLDGRLTGRLDGHVEVARRASAWRGSAAVHAEAMSFDPAAIGSVHGDVKLALGGGRLIADVDAATPRVGSARVHLDVVPPRDVADLHAWATSSRSVIHDLRLDLGNVDLEQVAKLLRAQPAARGHLSGTLHITSGDATAALQLRGIELAGIAGLGKIDGDFQLQQPSPQRLQPSLSVAIPALGRAVVQADVQVPDHVFERRAWQRLGTSVVQGVHVRTDPLQLSPATLERLGIATPLRGTASLTLDVDVPGQRADAQLTIAGLHGGPLAAAIDVDARATLDARSMHATLSLVHAHTPLATLDAEAAIALAELRANPRAVMTATLNAKLTFPHADVRQLLAVVGNMQVTGGSIDGEVDLTGTMRRPNAKLRLHATDVSVPATGTTRAPVMQQLDIDGSVTGDHGHARLVAVEQGGGRLDIEADGTPAKLARASTRLTATHFDLAPIVAFVPGPGGGLAGTLDGKASITGLDPTKAHVDGSLHITDGRLPLAPMVGTLFHADVSLAAANDVLDVKASGKLGRGEVELIGRAPLTGGMPAGGKLTLTLKNVQLITTTQPIITGTIDATVARQDHGWYVAMKVSKANVKVPSSKGQQLAAVGPPDDIVDGRSRRASKQGKPANVQGRDSRQVATAASKPRSMPAPNQSPLVADIELTSTNVQSSDLRGAVQGKLRVGLGKQGWWVTGDIHVTRGDLDLFGRRYQVERAALDFDGSLDPLVDVRISYDFTTADVTTVTEVHGRLSKPQLELSSQPSIYSDAVLIGFLLGGEPNGDSTQAQSASQQVASAGESLVGGQIAGYLKKALPFDIDVMRYEAATASSSAAVVVGHWITRELFLSYRERLEARPDENTGEGEVEYWLLPRLVVEGTIGDRGYDGADLVWRRRW